MALLLIVLLCVYYGMLGRRNAPGTVIAQTTDNRAINTAAVPRDAPPFETVKAFWSLSKRGDLQAIDNLITKIPPSYWLRCEETPSSKAFEKQRAERIARLPRIDTAPDGMGYDFRDDLEAKSIGLLKKSAEDLKTSQFQDPEFVEQRVYGDRIGNNYFSYPIYFMTRTDGTWRIFLESYRDFGFDDGKYFASPRPKCREK